ncbi:MAG TPA: nucleotide exchange factor GrpE [Candidatus Dormibacteraeota bacterium]|nr:nucleotide exchange factor GrpE [Candidatus Dormibacteraeota bacterium]
MSTNGSQPPEERPGLPEAEAEAEAEAAESPSERAEEDVPGELDPALLRREAEEYRDRYLRLAAEFENYKRRREQERVDSLRYAGEDAARTLLPVLDNLRRAVEHAGDGGGDVLSGLQLVIRDFENALERIGVTPVPTVGTAFDPALHEAIGGEERDDVEHDVVIDEIQPGYRLHDRLIRPALVRVAHPRHPYTAV